MSPLETAAVRFVERRDAAAKLRAERGAKLCERTQPERDILGSETADSPPCWKRPEIVSGSYGEPERCWDNACESCVERYEIHLRYREATKMRGAALRALTALARRRATS